MVSRASAASRGAALRMRISSAELACIQPRRGAFAVARNSRYGWCLRSTAQSTKTALLSDAFQDSQILVRQAKARRCTMSIFSAVAVNRGASIPARLTTSRCSPLRAQLRVASSFRCCPPPISSIIADQDDFRELPSAEGRPVPQSAVHLSTIVRGDGLALGQSQSRRLF
jgi:hypothetical protein